MARGHALVTAIIVAGCGRISFDPRGDVTTTAGDAEVNVDVAIDDAPGDTQQIACGPVTPGNCGGASRFAVCNGRCTVICDEPVVHATARTICGFWGGEVMWIRDAVDNACATALDTSLGARIGYVQAINAITVTSAWSWAGGHPTTYTNWETQEPQDADGVESGEEQCTVMFGPGTWRDTGCQSDQFAFLCSR